MAKFSEVLSGIERQLVLQYLIDGNVPVTLTPVSDDYNENDESEIHSMTSRIFPIAIKAEHINVSDDGIIRLENPTQLVSELADKKVKVEFYFNRVGLFFIEKVQEDKEGLFIHLPEEINRIKDVEESYNFDFSALIYFEYKGKKDSNTVCIPWNNETLFNRPAWKSIPLENQKKAKELLEDFVAQAKIQKNAGNGIQLIPVCNYLTWKDVEKIESVQNRIKPLDILYVDHERIVFGVNNISDNFTEGSEYGLKLTFSIKDSPVLSRDVFVTSMINKVYTSKDSDKKCIDCIYTTMQEEDLRYLYEKTTKHLFV